VTINQEYELQNDRDDQNNTQNPNSRFSIRKKINVASSTRIISNMNMARPRALRERLYAS